MTRVFVKSRNLSFLSLYSPSCGTIERIPQLVILPSPSDPWGGTYCDVGIEWPAHKWVYLKEKTSVNYKKPNFPTTLSFGFFKLEPW